MLERLMNLAVFQSIGPFELLIVLGIVLVIFGPKRLPSLGRQLGSGMREFKDSLTRKSDEDDEDDDSGAATRSQAAAALGRPDEETATQPASDGVISEKP
jgi:sec-independent protein translocase protein TatA